MWRHRFGFTRKGQCSGGAVGRRSSEGERRVRLTRCTAFGDSVVGLSDHPEWSQARQTPLDGRVCSEGTATESRALQPPCGRSAV
mmetsp:Transcript_29601/g.78367  ORF Transcript_29601/g.78367 Transcript_29601/m.78367 type:complete len:85 (-) Transcript_29601:107-361(-)